MDIVVSGVIDLIVKMMAMGVAMMFIHLIVVEIIGFGVSNIQTRSTSSGMAKPI